MNLIKKLTTSLVAIFLITPVFGQLDNSVLKPIHQLGIALGGINYQVKDDIVAPLRWDGFGFIGGFSYTITGDEGLHNVEFQVPYAPLTNRYEYTGFAIGINLFYRYLQKISKTNSDSRLYIGGMVDWNNNLLLPETWDDSHLYWLNVYEIGPSVKWNKRIQNKHQFSINFDFPLLAFVSRPPKHRYYDQEKASELLTKTHESMVFASLNKYKAIKFATHYSRKVNNKIELNFSYVLNYKTYSKPEQIIVISNTFQLKLLFTLKNNNKNKS